MASISGTLHQQTGSILKASFSLRVSILAFLLMLISDRPANSWTPDACIDTEQAAEADESANKDADKPKKKHDADGATFTLQVSSFQDKSEAEALLSTIRSSGYQAYLTTAEVDGKGTFYRVRVGKYGSMDAANDARAEFEKTAKRSALVTRL